MTSYLRSWFISGISEADTSPPSSIPTFNLVSPPPSDDEDGSATETEQDDDTPPAFPSLQSAQRMKSSTLPILTDAQRMPPPPLPRLAQRTPGVSTRPTVSTSSLALPPTTTKRPPKPSKKSGKVALAPGRGPLDWANLKSSGQDLRGVDTLLRIPPSVLKQHNTRDDAWSAFHGKVYNITPYMEYHPGGERDLLRVAGRDGTKLFASTHAWVNADFMLDACLVGFLVAEPSL